VLQSLTAVLEPDSSVALVAVDGSVLPGLERYLGFNTTLSADNRVHLPLPKAVAIPIALSSPGCPAFRTTLWLIGEAPGSEQRLLICTKSETCAALHALQGPVYVVHGQPPFLMTWSQLGHPWPREFTRNHTGWEKPTLNQITQHTIELQVLSNNMGIAIAYLKAFMPTSISFRPYGNDSR